MNRATSSLAIVLAEALALWQDLDGTSILDQEIAARAAHPVVAAETCHRALALAAVPLPPAPVVDQHPGPPVTTFAVPPCPEPEDDRVRTRSRRAASGALSSREVEVLRLIAAGYRHRQVAEALFVSPRTVTTHVSGILNKLGAESRTVAVAQAIRQGLV